MKTILKHFGTSLMLCVGTCLVGSMPIEAKTPETTVNRSLAAGLQAHSTWGCSIGRRSAVKTATSIGFGKSSIAKVGR